MSPVEAEGARELRGASHLYSVRLYEEAQNENALWGEMFRARAQKRRNPLITVPGLITSLASWLKGPMTVETPALWPRGLSVPGGTRPCPGPS